MAVYIVGLTFFSVWRGGFSEKVTERGRSSLPGLSELWFSEQGDLVGVAKQNDVVTIQPWVGGKPADLIKIDLEDLRMSTARVNRGQPLPPVRDVPFAVSRDMTRFVAAWGGILVIHDFINQITERVRLTKHPDDRLIKNPDDRSTANDKDYRPVGAEITTLALVGGGRLALLWNDRELEIRDSNRQVVISFKVDMLEPAALFASGRLLAVANAKRSRVDIYNLEGLGFGPIAQRSFADNPQAFSIAISNDRIAVADGTPEIAYIALPITTTYTAPGRVSAVSFHEENRLLVGGDFGGIHLISAGGESTELTREPTGVRLLARRGPDIAYAEKDGYALLSYLGNSELNSNGIRALTFGAVVLLLIPVFFSYIKRVGLRGYATSSATVISHTTARQAEEAASVKAAEPEVKRLPRPVPPPELVEMCAAGECVLYGGAGLAAHAGFPTWHNFLFELLAWAVERNFIEAARADSLKETIRVGRGDTAADSIYYELQQRGDLPALHTYLRDLFLRESPPPDVYRTLNQIPLAAILTTNFDNLFERTFEHREAPVFMPVHAEQLKTALSKYEFFILKLYGRLSQPEGVMVAPVQYERAVTSNRTFLEFMETLFFSRTILFVGSSLEGIEAYLKAITLPHFIPRKHYALIAVEGNAWQAQADMLERQYGIKVLPFTPTTGFPEVNDFLADLAQRVAAQHVTAHEGNREKSRITRVVLENIGPFDNLELKLDRRWNILLGDNGVGKSTILKAIALAICGKDAQPYAARLVKSGRDSALIVLETDNNKVYETRIFLRNGNGEITSKPARPLEIENWLVVGFPPLRTASWKRPEGPEAEPRTRSTSSPEDVLPLVRGELDPRMDKLKQWIVNLDYWKSKKESERPGSGALYDELIQEFFELVDFLTVDLKLKYKGIDEAYGIRVETRDGQIPIEAVSQGTTSLTGWVGILMQRLHEVYGHEDDPKLKPAIVLMDEIDAHMHPAWQQSLVHRFGKKFENLQFIGTTHSPLIIGGMPPEQLFRFMRGRDGKVVQIEVDPEMTMGRADQVLTGDLFGLETTIDPVTQGMTTEYQELLSLSPDALSGEQRMTLLKLREVLGFRIPETGETAPERRAQELLQALLLEQFGDKFPQVQRQILDSAQKLFAELQKQKEFKR